MPAFNTTLYRELDLDIEYEAHKSSRGARDKYGVQLEPDESAYVELTKVQCNGMDIELSESEEEQVVSDILESLPSKDDDDIPDHREER